MAHVLVGGGTGFIGSALAQVLRARGDRVTLISRTPGPGRITWDDLRTGGLPACDAVVNLAGKHILNPARRWTAPYRDEVIRSRVETTTLLVDAINAAPNPPEVFVSTAGKCFYGTRDDVAANAAADYPDLDEDSQPMGMDFPAELVGLWERAADHLDTNRTRHVRLRIGLVLGAVHRQSMLSKLWRISAARGLLPLVRLPFCLGIGAILGTGRQPFPWIHIDDMVGICLAVIDNPAAHGRYNCVAPGIVSNAEFTRRFAHHLRRPVVWSAPKALINALIGRERASILLEGQRVRPRRTLAMGYRFRFADIDTALDDLVQITA
ncbi:MAG: TIGR01777 family oxidoreductase [Pseudomonadota bacterium]